MQRFYESLVDRNGNPAAGVEAYVYNAQTGALATLYTDSEDQLTPTTGISNPIVTDASGQVKFAVPNGYYNIRYEGGNLASRSRTFVSLADQSASSELGYFLDGSTYFSAAELNDIVTRAGLLDVSTALNAATQAAITEQKRLILPTGLYNIDSPWMIMKWSGSAFSFFSVDIEGDKTAWTADYLTQINNVTIRPSYDDKPAICIQNGRAVRLKNITVIGQNAISLTFPDYPEMMTDANWVTGTCRDERYSPYSGIAIDPFGSSVPVDGGYPGLSAYYANPNSGSSDIMFENVKVTNFVTGFIISPNGTSPQGDMISFLNCEALYNKTGISVCQSQARGVSWTGGGIYWALYCFDGLEYGQRQGYAPLIEGGIYAGKYLFHVAASQGTQLIKGLYAESFASIGFLGIGSTSDMPVVFEGSYFNFTNQGGIFADWHLFTGAPIRFTGCTFTPPGELTTANRPSPLRFFANTIPGVTFDSCAWTSGGHTWPEFPLSVTPSVHTRQWENVTFDQCTFQDSTRGHANGKSLLGGRQRHYLASFPNAGVAVPGTMYEFLYTPDDTKMFRVVGSDVERSLGTLTVTVGANGTATFTVADGTLVNTGDHIFTETAVDYEYINGTTLSGSWSSIGIVTNVATNDITISGVPQSLVTGNYALYEVYMPRYHEPSTGDLNSSTSVTNVSPVGAWKNGQHIRATGIPAGAYIVSGGGTATLVLSKAATLTTVGSYLYDAVLEDVGALSSSMIHGVGYQAGSGGAVTQITSRTTGVTLNRPTGAITLVSAAGSASWQTFTLTNSLIAATDTVQVTQKSGADLNEIHVTAVAAGSCNITFRTTGGTTTEQPVFNFTVTKGAAT